MKPRIGIGSGAAKNEEHVFQISLSYSYLNSIREAGGVPIVLPPTQDDNDIETYLDAIDGLILPGGPDLPPSHYGRPSAPLVLEQMGPRRGYDVRLCQRALRRNLPILGVCLGCQVINVALGGTLIRDLLTQGPESEIAHRHTIFPYYTRHEVSVEHGSRLHAIVGGTRIETNSAHHQAVEDLGRGVRVVARADDGVVEAIECEDSGRFLLGIQWHPEKIAEREDGPHRSLFAALVAEAAGLMKKD